MDLAGSVPYTRGRPEYLGMGNRWEWVAGRGCLVRSSVRLKSSGRGADETGMNDLILLGLSSSAFALWTDLAVRAMGAILGS